MFNLSSWKRPRVTSTRASNRKTYRALRDLNNHTLKDIGLSRSDVESYRSGYGPHRGPDYF